MSFFKSLALAGITKTELLSFDQEGLVRLEKKLVAEHRLNGSISRNDIEQILLALKSYGAEIGIICSYPCLYGILTGEHAEYIDTIRQTDTNQTRRLKYTLSHFFEAELIAYINSCFLRNNWNDVRVLLHYKIFLSDEIIDFIKRKFTDKLDYALTVMKQKLSHRKLRGMLPFINKEFFETIGEFDNKYFSSNIDAFLTFIRENADYTKATIYFDTLIRYIYAYNPTDPLLRMKMFSTLHEYGGQRWIVYAVLLIMFGLFLLPFMCMVKNADRTNKPRVNKWTERDKRFYPMYDEQSFDQEEQKIKMENFVEARHDPQNYPLASWKSSVTKPWKYRNPFRLLLFNSDFNRVRNSDTSLVIYNHTNKECIVLAYYYKRYDYSEKRYVNTYRKILPFIHSLYIPPNDSIKIDAHMSLIRFYNGRRLASYNTYKHYVYPDSADVKFSKFTKADSVLFSRGFVIAPDAKAVKGQLSITIKQPDVNTYQIFWNGEKPLFQNLDIWRYKLKVERDSAAFDKPILIKDDILENDAVFNREEINSFLDPWQ